MKYILPLIVSVLMFQCSSKRTEQIQMIQGMEGGIEKNLKDEYVRPLLANYLKFCREFGDDEICPVFLYRAAVLFFRAGNYAEAAKHLETIIREYPNTEILEDTYLTLAMITSEKLQNKLRTEELYSGYINKFPKGYGIAAAEFYFLPEKDKIRGQVKRLLGEISDLPRGIEPSKTQYFVLCSAFSNFIKLNPNDPLSPAYCLQGARFAIRLGEYLMAMQFLDIIINKFPDYEQMPDIYFLQANIYESNIASYLETGKKHGISANERLNTESLKELNFKKEAINLYRKLIRKYPDSPIAIEAKIRIKNIGRSKDDIVEEMVRRQDSISIK